MNRHVGVVIRRLESLADAIREADLSEEDRHRLEFEHDRVRRSVEKLAREVLS